MSELDYEDDFSDGYLDRDESDEGKKILIKKP